ncbi:PKD domain-containing protein [Methylomonas sp. HYX-M1]|uniref:PKD domain-containing protein n=1 Tax=Methylomonas sp. HYX-M1 TaxID=3139307 RepID=UPI00345BE365
MQLSNTAVGHPRLSHTVLAMMIAANLAIPLQAAEAASPPKISAKAKLDKKLNKLVVNGKIKGITSQTMVNVYDVSDHRLLYSGQSDQKSRFNFQFAQDAIPCGLQIVVGDSKTNLAVRGADKTCKVQPSCAIDGGNRSVSAGSVQTFTVAPGKGKTNKNLTYAWSFGANNPLAEDGTLADAATGSSVSHSFSQPGLYRVSVEGANSGGDSCSDAVTVSVAPAAGSNPYATVAEAAARPKTAAGMPNADGSNDENAYVVFPFEEMGMEGGSQINIPFNPLFPYNAMNAQVVQKIEHKPVLVNSNDISVYYSAAINPTDPAGNDSINSTSQNLFADGIGANFDWDATVAAASTTGETVYKNGHEFTNAIIAKTEFWDKARQPNAGKLTTPTVEKGLSQADTQNSVAGAALIKPDQGIRGNSDSAAGVREMPGIDNPYQANEAKPFDYTGNLFVAQNIPLTNVDDQGRINPYPLLRVEAKTGNQTVAATDGVYTTASETGCVACHYKGEKGSDDKVWRTPVRITELVNADGTLGPATGKGEFPFEGADPDPATFELTDDPIANFKAYGYGPAVHNTFDNKFPLDPSLKMQADGIQLEFDANGIRKDRVAESRWLKPDGSTAETNPTNDPSWKLQIRLAFRDSSYYGEDTWQNREKAARWNTMLMHDYMTPINYRNTRDDIFAEIADDQYTTTRNTVTMCASHHGSTLKLDTGAAALNTTTVLSLWTRTTHAFHGKMQVYKRDVSASEAADGQAHQQGELIRNERGHPIMLGGRGWDPANLDAQGLYLKKDTDGNYTVKQDVLPFYHRNNWAPEQFPAHALGREMLPVGENIAMEENCLTCHTGNTEKSYRDIHHAAGMKCDSCHGGMLAVGQSYPNEMYDGNRTYAGMLGEDDPHSLGASDWRRQWIDEPDCGSCHVGDANLDKDGEAGLNHYFSAGALKQAWLDNDPSAASIFPVNARFAVMPSVETIKEKQTVSGVTSYVDRAISQALYRKSYDVHGSGANGNLYCSTCHGGSHAIWPNKDPNANDNVTSKQLQGYDGNIAECSTCHIKDDFKTGLVATAGPRSVAQGYREGEVVAPTGSGNAYLAGPHGMHPVGDPYWYAHAEGAGTNTSKGKHKDELNGGWHNDMAKKPGPDGEDQCAACHGADHKGTRLSRSLVNRELINAKGKTVKIVKDQVIGCDLCHSLQKSFTDVPTGQAQLHKPPEQAAVSSQSGGNGTGGH